MIIYTPLSEMDIFPIDDQQFAKKHCVSYQGKMVLVEEKTDGSYEMLSLLSSDPQDFLNPDLSPGTIIK